MNRRWLLVATLAGLMLLGGCMGISPMGPAGAEHGPMMGNGGMMGGGMMNPQAPTGGSDAHTEGDEHAQTSPEGLSAAHNVPPEAAAVENPIPASQESVAMGARLYAQNCQACHGPQGKGDGPAGMALNPRPADLTAEHVQANTDGALFYIITHGVPGTAMPGWSQLSEEDRWHLVNYLRSLASH
ncbi:cytochrome c [Litorilinea aerophila]|uniref:Cytochrome c n=1 Tax=Litorilinea aerophila TaxID=1204385 RepID=A0A540VJT1_9CHLR|nr:cytochrome c [Litorilinea aerophila]MCC9075512.1 cytochrome c [Litorilinea aerophila]GIV76398.1 MAG: hypothetical protein KatS3mg050_0792 [Litorilinea sp.]